MPHTQLEAIATHLAALVSFDTVSDKSNLPLIEYVENYLKGFGIASRRVADDTGQKAALWATIGASDQPGYILSGHTDVVPVDGQVWSSDPFTLKALDGKYYGRGATDMKGFLAVCLAMVPTMVAARLKTPIHFAFSYDEEVGCIGVRPLLAQLAEMSPRPLGCIVGEPTSMQPVIGHKSKCSMRAIVHGEAAHSSLAPRFVNAVEFAADLVVLIRDHARRLAETGARDTHYEIPFTTGLTSTIRGGTATNIVPARCEIDFEFRGIAADNPRAICDAVVAEARTKIEPAMHAINEKCGIEFEITQTYPGLDIAADHELVALAKHLSGRNSHGKMDYGTEAGLFMEIADIPSVVIGPGHVDQAHKPDEFIHENELVACAAFIGKLIVFCSGK